MRMTIVVKALVKGERIKNIANILIFTLNLNTLRVLTARKM